MAKGSKAKYTDKQKRMAAHIEESEHKAGRSNKASERIAWATVNKKTGGAGKAVKSKHTSQHSGSHRHG